MKEIVIRTLADLGPGVGLYGYCEACGRMERALDLYAGRRWRAPRAYPSNQYFVQHPHLGYQLVHALDELEHDLSCRAPHFSQRAVPPLPELQREIEHSLGYELPKTPYFRLHWWHLKALLAGKTEHDISAETEGKLVALGRLPAE